MTQDLRELLWEARESIGRVIDEGTPYSRDDFVILWHRIHAALATQPAQSEAVAHQGENIALLWDCLKALQLAEAICDAVPSRQPGHLGQLVNKQPSGEHGYHVIREASERLGKYLTTPTSAPPAQAQSEAVACSCEGYPGISHDFEHAKQRIRQLEQAMRFMEMDREQAAMHPPAQAEQDAKDAARWRQFWSMNTSEAVKMLLENGLTASRNIIDAAMQEGTR